MSVLFRLFLIVGALAAFFFILTKIRKSEIKIADATFWFLFAFGVVVLAIFPPIAYFFCDIFQVESPVHLVLLVIIAILIIRMFRMTVEMAKLRSKVTTLVQNEALSHHIEEKTHEEQR